MRKKIGFYPEPSGLNRLLNVVQPVTGDKGRAQRSLYSRGFRFGGTGLARRFNSCLLATVIFFLSMF